MSDGKVPKSALGILVDEKRVNELIMQKSGAKAVLKSAMLLLVFVSFLSLFTFLALSEPRSDFYAFEGYVRRRFNTMAAMPLHEVESASSFWRYMKLSFMPGLYGNDTDHYFYPDHVVPRFLLIEDANRLFGVGRLRMLKVKSNEDCSLSSTVERFFPTCFGPFDAGQEDKTNFGPPNMITGDSVFPHYSLAGGSVEGNIATYPQGGFMRPFTANYNNTLNSVTEMMENDFVGPGTRAIFLDWTIYNFNMGYYAVCRILFEVASSGKWVTTFEVDILMMRHLDAIAAIFLDNDWLPLVGQIFLMLFVLGYVLEEMSEFVGFHGWFPYIKWDYFQDAWNALDWLNLVLIVITFIQMIATWGSADALEVFTGDPNAAGLRTFTDLSATAASVRLVTRLIAFNTVLTWFKAVKYISVLPYITTFMDTVTMTQRAMGSFITIFACALFGFVLAFNVAFGEQISTLRTPWKSFTFLMRSFLGNADMALVLDAAPLLGSILTFMFVLSMIFVILNVFYAIMIGALTEAKKNQDKHGGNWAQTTKRGKDFWNTVSLQFDLEYKFRTSVPGLYARIAIYRRKQADKEQERDDAVLRRERSRKPDVALGLGPGDPSLGRRTRPALNAVSAEDMSDSDEGSEVDLGPLRHRDDLTGTRFANLNLGSPKNDLALLDSEQDGLVPFMLQDAPMNNEEINEDGIKLVIEATTHIVDGIVDRTHGARGVLFGEMDESKEVLLRVGSVLEVLGRRSRDLEAQQIQLLRMF